MLFVPGDRPERMDRAINSGADAVVFDLEDSVTAGRHDEARTSVQAKLGPGGTDRWVRILPYGSAEADRDLEAIVRPGLAGVILPEIRDAATVRAADARITQLEAAVGVTAGSIGLLPLIESALGLHRAFDILSREFAHNRRRVRRRSGRRSVYRPRCATGTRRLGNAPRTFAPGA